MGGEPWSCSVPFAASVETALEAARQQVFAAGLFRGSEAGPATPEEAVENMDADGTASVLDVLYVSAEPEFCAVCPLSVDQLVAYFGTVRPTRAMVEGNADLYERLSRGEGVYVVVYDGGDEPSEYMFAGVSFD